MSCLTNSGILLGCGDQSAPGLKNVWVGSLSGFTFGDLDIDVDGVITGMTSAVTGVHFYKYQSTKQTASFSEEAAIDITMNSIGYNSRLVMRFSRQDYEKRNEMRYFASTITCAIIEDYNGQFRLCAGDQGFSPEVLNSLTGAAFGEGNVYDITLLGQEQDMAPFIDSKSIFSDFIDVV